MFNTSAPHYKPSNQTLTKNPHKGVLKNTETLTTAPQKVWQTLKNFDDPNYFTMNYTLLTYIHCQPTYQMIQFLSFASRTSIDFSIL